MFKIIFIIKIIFSNYHVFKINLSQKKKKKLEKYFTSNKNYVYVFFLFLIVRS